jgi:hypothetical protein
MKYVVIMAIVVFIVRIDFWLGLIDKISFRSEPTPVEVLSSDLTTDRETISYAEDATLKRIPKQTFLSLLENFRVDPVRDVRERAMVVLKSHPTMLGTKLDADLESSVYRWRDLLINNDPEVVNFLLDLLSVMQGENLEMVRKFFSLWMEIDMENFIKAYSRTKDSNCMIATLFGDNLPEVEKTNEYYAREESLKVFIQKEKIDPIHKALAKNCLLVLGIQIAKIAPVPEVAADPEPAGDNP